MRQIQFYQAILEATDQLMMVNSSVYVMGLGVSDSKGVFGTTLGLKEKYKNRIIEMPISENGMTGVAIGSALMGMRPIMIHQRVDFILLALDQLINNAAKWYYMFRTPVPIVIRLFVIHLTSRIPKYSRPYCNDVCR